MPKWHARPLLLEPPLHQEIGMREMREKEEEEEEEDDKEEDVGGRRTKFRKKKGRKRSKEMTEKK